MKKLAYKFNNHHSEIITVQHALNLKKKNPQYWGDNGFYDLIKLRKMYPVDRCGPSSSFSFQGQTGASHGKGSKGITHELVQQYLCLKEDFSFKIFGKQIDLKVKNAFEEWCVVDPNDPSKKVYIDCCLELDRTCAWYGFFGGKIGFEITDTSKTNRRKINLLNKLGLFVFELTTIPEWHIKNDDKVTAEELKILKARIRGYLNSVQSMSALSLPKRI
ncbi:hypothetical protein R1U57_002452 [Vibrio parahaemolyticus]|nr:hypothetical protein [Vibrio parahaemolyticus]